MDGGGEGLVGSVGDSIMIQALESLICGIWELLYDTLRMLLGIMK